MPGDIGHKYEFVPGHFAHDEADEPLSAIPPRFGLKNTSKDRWEKLFEHIHALNDESPKGTSYKFFLLSRHGQGYHNVAEAKYGRQAWNDPRPIPNLIDLADPQLSPIGIGQAHTIQCAWMEEAAAGLSPPHKRYCSPLSRALDICDLMLNKVFSEHLHPVLVLENCREENGVHTCDKRRTRSYISDYKPHFAVEETFEEYDQL
ncbi:hypothetical protein BDZ97DRAFT_1921226 [Flammula alnicola]|nr:hypothetical protein BDZ97DRAFT_1921226 [Flammula alnicola]